MTREPGDLLPAMVMCERVGRGAPKRCESRCGLPCRAKGRLSRPTYVTALLFAVESHHVSISKISEAFASSRVRARSFHLFSSRQRWLSGAALPLGFFSPLPMRRHRRKTSNPLIRWSSLLRNARQSDARRQRVASVAEAGQACGTADGAEAAGDDATGRRDGSGAVTAGQQHDGHTDAAQRQRWSRPAPAGSASPCMRCRRPWTSLPSRQMREQGYRTTTETALGAVGVLAADVGGGARRLFPCAASRAAR